MTSVDAKETQEKQVNAVPESKEPAPIATTEASEKAPAKQDEDEEEYNEDEDEDFVRGRMLTGRSSTRTMRKTTMRRKKRMMTKTTTIMKMMTRKAQERRQGTWILALTQRIERRQTQGRR